MSGTGPAPFGELPLLVWLSPAYPVGGFAYSHGIEAAAEAGLLPGREALADWIGTLLAQGSLRQDVVLMALAARAAGDAAALDEVNALALALAPARERRLETAAMGNAFRKTLAATWPGAGFPALPGEDIAYPVAVGLAAAAEGLAAEAALAAYALAFVANLVSAAIRLGVVGQTDGQRVTAGALPAVRALAAEAAGATADDLGACAFRSDLAALHHETQYSRLFRS